MAGFCPWTWLRGGGQAGHADVYLARRALDSPAWRPLKSFERMFDGELGVLSILWRRRRNAVAMGHMPYSLPTEKQKLPPIKKKLVEMFGGTDMVDTLFYEKYIKQQSKMF